MAHVGKRDDKIITISDIIGGHEADGTLEDDLALAVEGKLSNIRLDVVGGDDIAELHALGDSVDHASKDIGTHGVEALLGGELLHGSTVVVEDTLVGVECVVLGNNERVLGSSIEVLGDDTVVEAGDVLLERNGCVVVGVGLDASDIREVNAVNTTEGVATSNHGGHVLLGEASLLESGKGLLEVGGGLRDTGGSRLAGIDTASSEWDVRAGTSSGGNNSAEGDEISSTGTLVVEAVEKAESVVPSFTGVLSTGGLPEDGSVKTSSASLGIVCDGVVESCSDPFGRVLSSRLAVAKGASNQSCELLV